MRIVRSYRQRIRPAPVSELATGDEPDRLSIAWISFGHLSSDLSQGAVPALLPYLISHRGLSYGGATALLLALTLASSIIQPLFGMRSDRVGDVWLMPLGAAVAGHRGRPGGRRVQATRRCWRWSRWAVSGWPPFTPRRRGT